MNLKLRYIQNTQQHYQPQYKSKDGNWTTFRSDNFPKKGEVANMIRYIAECKNTNGWGYAQWAYGDTKEIFFLNELSVMAFLGVAKHYFKENITEVNI